MLSNLDLWTWIPICIIYTLQYLSKELYGCEQMEFSLNCYQHSCLRVDLFPSDTGIMHEVKQNLWRNVMDGWQSQNEFVLLWDILTHFILIWPRGDQRVFVRYMPDSWSGFDRMRVESWVASKYARTHLNPKNYYCSGYSIVKKCTVTVCHFQLLDSNRNM